MCEPIEGTLAEHGVVEERAPLLDCSITGQYRGTSPVPFQNDLVEVARLLCVETTQPEVVDDQNIRGK